MACAIRLSDAVNTVSPSYAEEIQRSPEPESGFSGGEGLEEDLRRVAGQERLHGILNGCAYPTRRNSQLSKEVSQQSWNETLALIAEHRTLLGNSGHARERLERLATRRPRTVLLSIGRTVAQKVSLLLAPAAGRETALEAILDGLEDGLFIMLGSGEAELEAQLAALAARRDRFVYLRGYAERLSDPLYETCDLFLMPSSFEPCGISQMLAMRAGMPCVVHSVGGLRDTVEDGVTGFVFGGASPAEQAEAFVRTTRQALELRRRDPAGWETMRRRAAEQRFDWDLAAREYTRRLYADGVRPHGH
jgi:starch synthase